MQAHKSSNYPRKLFKYFIRRSYLIPIALILCFAVIYLGHEIVTYVQIRTAEEDYARKKARLVEEKYNEYGLRDDKVLSENVYYTADNMYIFTDRILYRFNIAPESASIFRGYVPVLRKAFGDARITVLPIPYRIMYEQYSDDSNEQFAGFVASLRRRLPPGVGVADCSSLIREDKGRNLFYRTESSWNMAGAYFGYAAFCNENGIEAYPEDYFILYQNNSFRGGLVSQAIHNEIYGYKVEEVVEDFEDDPLYYRLARNAKNYEFVRTNNKDEYKRPIVFHGVAGTDSFVGSNLDYAIIPGNAEDGCLILITDEAGKVIAPYLAQHYETVVVFDVEKYDASDYRKILAPYNVTDVLITQLVDRVGVRGYSKMLNSLME